MNQSNEIALQLVNNYTEDINIALFPNVNNSQFVQSQTEQTVQGQQYNIGTTTTNISGPLTIQQKNKLTSEEITLVIPYIGIDGFFVPNDFIQFLANWFQENNYGYVYENEAPLMTIYSDLYEYGKFQFSDA
jgi:hypothetical protein